MLDPVNRRPLQPHHFARTQPREKAKFHHIGNGWIVARVGKSNYLLDLFAIEWIWRLLLPRGILDGRGRIVFEELAENG